MTMTGAATTSTVLSPLALVALRADGLHLPAVDASLAVKLGAP